MIATCFIDLEGGTGVSSVQGCRFLLKVKGKGDQLFWQSFYAWNWWGGEGVTSVNS